MSSVEAFEGQHIFGCQVLRLKYVKDGDRARVVRTGSTAAL